MREREEELRPRWGYVQGEALTPWEDMGDWRRGPLTEHPGQRLRRVMYGTEVGVVPAEEFAADCAAADERLERMRVEDPQDAGVVFAGLSFGAVAHGTDADAAARVEYYLCNAVHDYCLRHGLGLWSHPALDGAWLGRWSARETGPAPVDSFSAKLIAQGAAAAARIDARAIEEEREKLRTVPYEPGVLALWLVRTVALDAAEHHAGGGGGQVPPNRAMFEALGAVVGAWQREGELEELLLAAVERVAVQQCGQLLQRYEGDHERVRAYLVAFGDEVAAAQQHAHPAGPTAVAVLDVVGAHAARSPGRPLERGGYTALAAAMLTYLRPDREVEDARGLLLTLGLWAGEDLAELVGWVPGRIVGATAEFDALTS